MFKKIIEFFRYKELGDTWTCQKVSIKEAVVANLNTIGLYLVAPVREPYLIIKDKRPMGIVKIGLVFYSFFGGINLFFRPGIFLVITAPIVIPIRVAFTAIFNSKLPPPGSKEAEDLLWAHLESTSGKKSAERIRKIASKMAEACSKPLSLETLKKMGVKLIKKSDIEQQEQQEQQEKEDFDMLIRGIELATRWRQKARAGRSGVTLITPDIPGHSNQPRP